MPSCEVTPTLAIATCGGPATTEDLSTLLLRRLHDEDPQVVISVTDHDVLVRRILLGLPDREPDNIQDDGVHSTRAVSVVSTVASAAVPWLASLSEDRTKHPVALAGRVVCGLIRTASVACSALPEGTADEETATARNAALRLLFECLPGPHANARVKVVQPVASSGVSQDGAVVTGKARKRAMRAVGRSAIEAVCSLKGGSTRLFDGVEKVLEKANDDEMEEEAVSVSSKKGKRRSKANEMDVTEPVPVKSKGLKAMGEELCELLAGTIAKGDGEDILQVGKI